MCILFIHVDPNPSVGEYRLILAANRDEYYQRPSKKTHIDKDTNIIGGQDMEPGREGGTWLAFKSKDQENGKGKKHCVGVILNITGVSVQNPSGRGQIITNYLLDSGNFDQYSKLLDQTLFNGYNFVAVELSKDNAVTYHHGNIPKINSSYTGKHTLAFGNTPLFSPVHKVRAGKHNFEELLGKNLQGKELEEALLLMLKDTTRYLPDEELERRQPLAFEALSSIFIKLNPPGYGTRTHTLILIDYDWNLTYVEHTMEEPIDVNNPKWSESRIELRL